MSEKKIKELIEAGALFVINHSAGKDSQAMTIVLRGLIPAKQLLVVHADLGEVEWSGNVGHIQNTIGNLPFVVCRNLNKTFFQMVEWRGMWPSAVTRQCTSDLKRSPIERTIRHYLKDNPQYGGKVVNCMGIRAQESAARSKRSDFRFIERNSISPRKIKATGEWTIGREWYEWLPIFDWSAEEVFASIAHAGQKPHWAYSEGMSRLSCSFCILANRSDLCTAARLRPDLYRRYVDLEKRIGHTMAMDGRGLEEVTGIKAN